MKKLILSISLALFAVGCSTASGTLGGLLSLKTNVVSTPVTSPIISTMFDVVTLTNGVTVTNVVSLTNFVTHTVTTTNVVYVSSPVTQDVLSVVDTAGALVPPPIGSIIGFAGSVAALLLGVAVKRKNAALDASGAQNESLVNQLKAVVIGVEKAAAVLPEGSQIKKTIETVATRMNVASDLHDTVKANT